MVDCVSQIKERILVSEIIRERVKLQKKGLNFVGRCPFHHEKTPSFTVNDSKKFYYCFGCGAHGDIFNFIMKFEGITFMQAVSNLAERAGITIETKQRTKYYQYDTIELAVEWLKKNLYSHVHALKYLRSRHISDKYVKIFEIGYSPPGGIKEYLKSKGCTESQAVEAGLISKNYKEYFYDRIIFPIHDINGRVIALGGRTLHDANPKYLNSPETAIFKKSETLYGLHLARREKTDNIIIVEGYFDVIALHQSGAKNVIAPLGTALTILHLQKLCQLYKEITICFDGDNAGRNAILKTIKLVFLTEYTHKVKFVLLPNGKDPYDVVTQDGSEIFQSLLECQRTISETLWEMLSAEADLSRPEAKVKLKHELFECASIIEDKSVRRYYQSFFTKKLYFAHKKKSNSYNLLSSINVSTGEILIKIALSYPELLDSAVAEEQFATFKMDTTLLRNIQDFIVTTINEGSADKLSDPNAQGDFSSAIKKILNNHYKLKNKEQASILWNRLMLTEEIKYLEQEYNSEIIRSLKNNQSDNKESEILASILELKSSLHNDLE